MDKKQLQRLIASLHEELSSAESVDEHSRALLRNLTEDIEGLASSDVSQTGAAESAAGQLEDAAVRFETEHPKLSMALGELVDALGKLGI